MLSPFLTPILLIFLIALCRGASFLFIKYGIDTIPIFTLVFLRVAIATVVLGGYLLVKRISFSGDSKSWRVIIIIGIVGNVIPFSLVSFAEKHIDSGLTGLLIGTVPMFVFILAFFLAKDEAIDKAKVFGVVLGLIGVGIIYYPEISFNNVENMIAILSAVLAAIAYAISTILAKKVKNVKPEMIATAVTFIAAITLVPAVIYEQPNFPQFSLNSLYATIALGVISTAIPFVIMYGLIASKGATYFTMNNYLIPIVALALGIVFADEVLTIELTIASVFIFAGIYMCISKRFRS